MAENATRGSSVFFRTERTYGGCCSTIPRIIIGCVSGIGTGVNASCGPFGCCNTRSTRRIVITVNSIYSYARRIISCLGTTNRGINLLGIRLCEPFITSCVLERLPGAIGAVSILSEAGRPNSVNRPLCLSILTTVGNSSFTNMGICANECNLNSGSAAPNSVVTICEGTRDRAPGEEFAVNVISSIAGLSLPVIRGPSAAPGNARDYGF